MVGAECRGAESFIKHDAEAAERITSLDAIKMLFAQAKPIVISFILRILIACYVNRNQLYAR
ncbi:MAG: hypothetical protein MUO63_05275 [Desulfobulbaceae bacterium]|nr:hypothetical protein [Desulfobulbaceae bacterium]